MARRSAVARRSPTEIRNSMEVNRAQLEHSMTRLRGEVAELTDWRLQVGRHRREAIAGAAIAGFLIGSLLFPRRR
jgi:hypothetical protein